MTQLVADPNLPEPAAAEDPDDRLHPRHRHGAADVGADDVIHGNTGRDRIFGGNGNDTITGDGEPNTIFGDHGHMQYIAGATDVTTLHLVESTRFALGGVDHITADGGDDFIFGGSQRRPDRRGRRPERRLRRPRPHHRHREQRLQPPDPQSATPSAPAARRLPDPGARSSSSRSPSSAGGEYGGNDRIFTGVGRDEIFGGAGNDTIVAQQRRDRGDGRDHNNIVFGDYGFVDYLVDDIADGLIGGDPIDTARDIDRVWSLDGDVSLGGNDTITTGVDAYDIIIGGDGNDTITRPAPTATSSSATTRG